MPKWSNVTKFTSIHMNLRATLSKQMHSAEYECSMPSSAAPLPIFVRCVYRWMFYAVLPESDCLVTEMRSDCIWPDKGVYLGSLLSVPQALVNRTGPSPFLAVILHVFVHVRHHHWICVLDINVLSVFFWMEWVVPSFHLLSSSDDLIGIKTRSVLLR